MYLNILNAFVFKRRVFVLLLKQTYAVKLYSTQNCTCQIIYLRDLQVLQIIGAQKIVQALLKHPK